MAKIKIFELAKEMNVPNRDIIAYLQEQGVSVKTHMNNIEGDMIEQVRKHFQGNTVRPAADADTAVARNPKTPPQKNEIADTNLSNQGQTTERRTQSQMMEKKAQNQASAKEKDMNQAEKKPQGQEKKQSAGGRSGARSQAQTSDRRQGQTGQGTEKKSGQNERRNQGLYGDRKPVGQGAILGQGERRSQNQGEKKTQNSSGTEKRGAGTERRSGQYGDRRGADGQRPQGDRRPSDGSRNTERRQSGQGTYERRSSDGKSGQYGERRQSDGQRPQGDRRPSDGSRGTERRSYGDRKPSDSSRQGGSFDRRGSFADKDKDKDSRRGGGYGQDRRGGGRDVKSSDKTSLKADLANELTKEQRAAAFNEKNREKNRDRNRDREMENGNGKSGGRKGKDPNRKGAFIMPKPVVTEAPKEEEIRSITIPEVVTIKELAEKMKQQPSAVVKKLFLAGKMVSINQEISFEEAEEIALEFNCVAEKEVPVNVIEELLKEDEEDPSTMVKRPPVVCVMGHVDHGKTSLLDAIRESNVTAKEAGGITQHIGAYMVTVNGEAITFLDTPGHEAFTSMRMRGAQATDIAILVVAADDGVMPQTVEAINHAKAAGVQIIVAINKIDKPSANIDRVKQELTEYGLVAEDWGGDTVFVPVSAHTKEGIDTLLEMILLTAEVCELKANPNRRARGIVIEAELDKGRGSVATILVQKGTLHVGDNIAIGSAYGKVRAMMDDKGRRVKEATPSTPVEILGLNEVPDAGEIFIATESEKEARTIAEAYISQGREKLLADTRAKLSLDGLFSQIKAGNIKELNIVVKADVQGSVEAVKQSLQKLSNDEVAVRIIHGGVGAINESDVMLASASNAIVIGFNVRPDNVAKETAEREKVDLRLYRVIYDAINDIEAAMKGMLDPVFREKIIGHAEVRQVFRASGVGSIAGSYVTDGKVMRGCSARVIRDGIVIFDGGLASLKRFKDDVKEVASNYECGLVFEKFNDVKEGDTVEFYVMEEVPR